MAVIITGKDEPLTKWVARRIPAVGDVGFGPSRAVGVATGFDASDRLLAAFVFHDYQAKFGTCQLSGAAADPHWASRSIVRAVLSVPFLQYQCGLVWCACPHTSDRTIRLLKALGFIQEAILKDRFGKGSHAVITRMDRHDYERRYYRDSARKAA